MDSSGITLQKSWKSGFQTFPITRQTVGSPPGAGPRSQVTVTQLPEVPLIHIFGYLDKQDKAAVAGTCSTWRNLVYTPSLWRQEHAYLHLDSLSSADIRSLKRRGIREVTVLSCSKPVKMQELIHTVDSIEKFTALRCTLTLRQITYVFSTTLSNLKLLRLQVPWADATVSRHLVDQLTNLETLELVGPWNEDTLSAVSTVRQVKTLTLIDPELFPHNVRTIPLQPVEMPCLTALRMYGAAIGDAVLSFLKVAVPNLCKLRVELCDRVTQRGIEHIAELNDLEELIIFSKHRLPSLASISKMKKLQMLDLFHATISNADLKFLGQLPTLKYLYIPAGSLEENGWKQFSQGFKELQTLSLRKLRRLTKREVGYLGQLPCLEELETDLAVDLPSVCQTLNNLKSLRVFSPIGLTDKDMEVIGQMPRLESLVLSNIWTITDEGLRYLSEGRAPLEILGLQETKLTGRGLLHLAERPRTLRELGIAGTQKCLEGLPELLQRNQSLQTVKANVTGSMKRKLKQLQPGLVIKPSVGRPLLPAIYKVEARLEV